MKRYFFLFSLLIVKIVTDAQPLSHLQSGRSATPYLSSSQGDGITGGWSLVLQAFDDNSNGKLDEEERKKGNTGKHFYQFNEDGTCLIHTLKLRGSYELKNENGKKRLYTYVNDEGTKVRENAWYIISVTKTEMILLSQDKYAFWIYKRV
ncbi:MAG TPA: hypothetical protein VFU29_00395 [Chitinophagaceae bacterium]|nr:hypothetical protein [Chitinophagaceae bacterium]